MNKFNRAKRSEIIASLVEGSSLRATARMRGVAFNTVLKLVPDVGAPDRVWTIEELVSLLEQSNELKQTV